MTVLAWLLAGVVALFGAGGLATALISRQIEMRHPPEGRFVPVAGGRLHVREAGSPSADPAIVLLHGASGTSGDAMLALGEALGPGRHVVAFDRPGHGWSDRIAGSAMASPARQAAVIREALGTMGIARAIVVGHSWSGALATALALDHPDIVAGLVVVSGVTHPWPQGKVSWYYGPATARTLGWLFTRTITTPAGALLVDRSLEAVFAPQSPPPDYRARSGLDLVLRPPTFQANAEDVAGLHAFVTAQSAHYGAIRAPTIVIGGDVDRIVSTDLHARSLARDVPGARLVVLPGIGHMVHYAAPQVIVDAVDRLTREAAPALSARP